MLVSPLVDFNFGYACDGLEMCGINRRGCDVRMPTRRRAIGIIIFNSVGCCWMLLQGSV